jgi:mannose-6-phosphate isomerase-like protein (cupin superfamily)
MADYSTVRLDEIEGGYGGVFKGVRKALGCTAFGINVLDLPADFADYPEHDHGEDRQEEVYTALSGSAELDIEGERVALEPGVFVRVAPGTRRKVYPGPDGIRMLAVGCKAGAYVPEA